jgi:hypothetical protein
VALQANAIAWSAQLGGMGVKTIAACDAGREHLALLERTVIVLLVAHLPVRMIKPASKERDGVRVGQGLSRHPVFRKFAASRMVPPAGLDLSARLRRRDAALGIAGSGIGLPGDAVPFVQQNDEPLARVFVLSKTSSAGREPN